MIAQQKGLPVSTCPLWKVSSRPHTAWASLEGNYKFLSEWGWGFACSFSTNRSIKSHQQHHRTLSPTIHQVMLSWPYIFSQNANRREMFGTYDPFWHCVAWECQSVHSVLRFIVSSDNFKLCWPGLWLHSGKLERKHTKYDCLWVISVLVLTCFRLILIPNWCCAAL